MTSSVKLDFALSRATGFVVDIGMVASGLNCGCVCPRCGTELIAKKGIKNEQHFAHRKDVTCRWGRQESFHNAAIDQIARWEDIFLPSFVLHTGRVLPNERVRIDSSEKPDLGGAHDYWKAGAVRPDVILHTSIGIIWCEVKVTHGIDAIKRKRIEALNVATIEFDLSKYYNREKWTIEKLSWTLKTNPWIVKWVFHPLALSQ